ncbi:GATA transcription factor 2 [Cryptomeria japonica]|uniref:GATA transcription factor 2 n=1 Tax=Cryptomeria japonica TaxID=3369 RepID=UPI0025AB71FC|nr:GATA transcription factor 2 [Cryptomeria japonica]XP_057863740.1 GATA transcription factor 2 [Cryptomeria japonica]
MEAPTYLYDTNYGAPLIEGRKSNGKITEFKTGVQVGDFFHIDDLLDFSNEEIAGPIVGESAVNWPNYGTATDSSTITMTETVSCNSSVDGNSSRTYNVLETDENNPAELCVPCDDLAELEWLSNFVEDSFSTEEAPKAFFAPNFGNVGTDKETQLRPHTTQECGNGNTSPNSVLDTTSSTRKTPTPGFSPETPVPGRARSKRSRPPVCNWSSRIVSPTCSASTALENGSTPTTSALSSDSDFFAESSLPTKKPAVKTSQGMGIFQKKIKQEQQVLPMRKCMHCATVKTPQWRTGPMGPKTLCNACGVRFKSGRLVPEYRPAASPTFVATKHSNSHRKVIEMRRQKEMAILRHGLKDSEEEIEFSDHGDDEDGDAEKALEDHHHSYFVSDDDTYFIQHYKTPSNLAEVENPIPYPLYNF